MIGLASGFAAALLSLILDRAWHHLPSTCCPSGRSSIWMSTVMVRALAGSDRPAVGLEQAASAPGCGRSFSGPLGCRTCQAPPEPGRLNIRTRIALTVIVLVGFRVEPGRGDPEHGRGPPPNSRCWPICGGGGRVRGAGHRGRRPANRAPVRQSVPAPGGGALQRAALKPTEGQLGLVTGQAPWPRPKGSNRDPRRTPR